MEIRRDENGNPRKAPFSLQMDLSKFNAAMFEKATDEEKSQQDVMSESTTFFKDGMRKLFRNPLAVGSIIVLSLILLIIIFAPLFVPYSYEEILSVDGVRDKGAKNLAPFTYSRLEQQYIEAGGTRFPHIFGTDEQCRDYFIRVIYGTRVSLVVEFFASIIVLIIGMLYGSISGYLGGKVDLIMMRIVDIISSVPSMLYVILLMVVLHSQSLLNVFLVIGMTGWLGMARLVRTQVMSLKEREFILAAKVSNVSNLKLITKHLIPNSFGPIVVSMTLSIPSAIFLEASLQFLGLGIAAPMPSWGGLAQEGITALRTFPHLMWIPSVFISVTILAFNFLGDAMRDALDPTQK